MSWIELTDFHSKKQRWINLRQVAWIEFYERNGIPVAHLRIYEHAGITTDIPAEIEKIKNWLPAQRKL